jgi:hypothetical protein
VISTDSEEIKRSIFSRADAEARRNKERGGGDFAVGPIAAALGDEPSNDSPSAFPNGCETAQMRIVEDIGVRPMRLSVAVMTSPVE